MVDDIMFDIMFGTESEDTIIRNCKDREPIYFWLGEQTRNR